MKTRIPTKEWRDAAWRCHAMDLPWYDFTATDVPQLAFLLTLSVGEEVTCANPEDSVWLLLLVGEGCVKETVH